MTKKEINSKIVELNNNNFNSIVLNSEGKPVLVYFWAEWAAICKMVDPTIRKIASDYYDKIIVGNIDVDKNLDIVAKYCIRTVPSFLFFKDGEVADICTGATPLKVLNQKIENLLK